jgi:Fic family protein
VIIIRGCMPKDIRIDPRQAQRIAIKRAKLDALRPLPPAVVAHLQADLRIRATYHSNAIEGNTLSLRETQVVIEHGITIGGKTLREHLEAINHAQALDTLVPLADATTPITSDTVLTLHRIVMGSLLSSAGAWRRVSVRILGASVVPPSALLVPEYMRQWVDWIGDDGEGQRYEPIARAAIAHHGFEAVHPFEDGNGRVGRLLLGLMLMRAGYPPPVIRLDWRLAYLAALDAGNVDNHQLLLNLIARAVEENLDMTLAACADAPAAKALPLRELALLTGMEVDYLGWLARAGRIAASKRGGRWYSTQEAIASYQRAVAAKEQPRGRPRKGL